MENGSNLTQENKTIVYIDSDLEDIVPGFLDSKRSDINNMFQCLKENNFHPIQVLGHKMKGDGKGYGFDMISDVGADLETFAMEEKKEEIKVALEKLNNYLSSIEIVYKDMD